MLGLFWSRTTATAALISAVISAVLSLLLKVYWSELPFMDRVGLVFLLCIFGRYLSPDARALIGIVLGCVAAKYFRHIDDNDADVHRIRLVRVHNADHSGVEPLGQFLVCLCFVSDSW